MNLPNQEISTKSYSIKQLREKYRVEIKKQTNENIFNTKRLKFSEKIQNSNGMAIDSIAPSSLVFIK